jgi:site-specific DNA-methyltransferase (adenine-specific)/modification methylase
MTPYYETPCKTVRIFHARWEDVSAAGVFKAKDIALVHADPPYGVNERTDRKAKGRGKPVGSRKDGTRSSSKALAQCVDFPAVVGDDEPFDTAPLLELDRPTVLWGANHYSERVPGGPSWITWDKRNGGTSNDNADCEHAWSNLGGPARLFCHLWRGMMRASEHGDRFHPTQKPEALSAWVFAHAESRKKLKRGDTILVPYMGSGPDLRPAMAAGYKVIACDVEEWCCRTAVSARLRAMPKPEQDSTLGPLFVAR